MVDPTAEPKRPTGPPQDTTAPPHRDGARDDRRRAASSCSGARAHGWHWSLPERAADPGRGAAGDHRRRPASGPGAGVPVGRTANGALFPLAALAIVLPLFLPIRSRSIAGDSVAGEAQAGTLRYLLARPGRAHPAAGGQAVRGLRLHRRRGAARGRLGLRGRPRAVRRPRRTARRHVSRAPRSPTRRSRAARCWPSCT